jgi:hypothetical protein
LYGQQAFYLLERVMVLYMTVRSAVDRTGEPKMFNCRIEHFFPESGNSGADSAVPHYPLLCLMKEFVALKFPSRASSNNSNKSTNQMQQFHKFIT